MCEIHEFTCSISNSNGKRRVSECAYSGKVDDEDTFKLSRCVGHIYPAETITADDNGSRTREEINEMSRASQIMNMKAIHSLVSQDFGYIFGDREAGPNGAKKMFHSTSKAFLRALGNDLGFTEFKVTNNPGGIAVGGEITLRGMWGDDNGLYLQIFQSLTQQQEFLYRQIAGMKDFGGSNQWLDCSLFENGNYEKLIDTLLALRKPSEAVIRHVA